MTTPNERELEALCANATNGCSESGQMARAYPKALLQKGYYTEALPSFTIGYKAAPHPRAAGVHLPERQRIAALALPAASPARKRRASERRAICAMS